MRSPDKTMIVVIKPPMHATKAYSSRFVCVCVCVLICVFFCPITIWRMAALSIELREDLCTKSNTLQNRCVVFLNFFVLEIRQNLQLQVR